MTLLEKSVRILSRVLAVLSAASIVAMVLAVATDVVVRNATGASLRGMVEIAETSLVISVFFGLAWAGVKGEHVSVTLLVDRFNAAWTRITQIFVWTLSSGFLVWLLYATTMRAIDSTSMQEQRFGLVRWPLYPLRWVIVIGVAALLLVTLLNLLRTIAGKSALGPDSELEAVLAQNEEPAAASGELISPTAAHGAVRPTTPEATQGDQTP